MVKGDIPQSGTEQPERKIHIYAIVVALLAVFVLLVTLGFYFLNFHAKLSVVADWGTFGDFVGGTLNPIFSLMSLLALLYTILLQTKEMAQTREELKRTADAQAKTEQALNGQLEAQKIQQFEGTFFALLDQHNKALDRVMKISETRTAKKSNLGVLKDEIIKGAHNGLSDAKSDLKLLDHLCRDYFLVLYQLLKFIKNHHAPNESIGQPLDDSISIVATGGAEKTYSSIVRALINNDLLELLTIYCFCTNQEDPSWKYKLLIERYALLKHMTLTAGGCVDRFFEDVRSTYDQRAFGNSTD